MSKSAVVVLLIYSIGLIIDSIYQRICSVEPERTMADVTMDDAQRFWAIIKS